MKTYLIKDENNKIFGPYAMEKLIFLAKERILIGEEQLSVYPKGDWYPISQHPELYNIFLDHIANETQYKTIEEREQILEKSVGTQKDQESFSSSKENEPKEMDEPQSTKPHDNKEIETASKKKPNLVVVDEQFKKPRSQFDSKKGSFDRPSSTIGKDLVFTKHETGNFDIPLDKKNTKRNFIRPLLVLAAGFLAAMLYIGNSDNKKLKTTGPLHFKLPRFSTAKKQISIIDQKKRLARLIGVYQVGDYENLVRLQNALVSFIEKAPKNNEAYSLLCMAYWDIWPYTNKGSKELSKINILSQKLAQLTPNKIQSARCETVKLLLGNNYDKANEIVDGLLAAIKDAPFFYLIKAEILYTKQKYRAAIDYALQSLHFLPQWSRPRILIGKAFLQLKNYNEAHRYFLEVRKNFPEHEETALYLAELEYQKFHRVSSAKLYLKMALHEDSVLPNDLMARAYFSNSLIFQSENNMPKALKNAQQAYQLQPNQRQYRDHIIRLGGKESLKGFNERLDIDLVSNGDYFYRNKNYIAAQAEYKEAFKQNPKNSVAAMKAGKSLWKLGQRKEAILWQNRSLQADKKNLEAQLLLIQYLSENYDFNGAQKILRKILKKYKYDYRVFKSLAQFEFRRKNFNGALAASKNALKLYDSDAEIFVLISMAYNDLEKTIEAYQAASQAISLEPTNVEAQAHYSKILARYSGLQAGKEYVTNLILTYPSVLEYRVALAEMYKYEKKYSDAVTVLLQLVDSEVYDRETLFLLGKIYYEMQDLKLSLKYYLKTAEEAPEDVEPLFEAAKIFYLTKKYNNAQEVLSLVAERNPHYPMVYYWMGRISLLQGDHEKAFDLAKKEMSLNPKTPDPYILAGDVSLKTREYTKALGYYRNGIKIQPQDVAIYVKMAKAHRLLGNLDIAHTMLVTAQKKESGFGLIYKELGALLEQQGKDMEAVEAYKKYLTLIPGAEDAQVIQGIISKLGG